jgi:DNA-directed RNA polymerase subunit omega
MSEGNVRGLVKPVTPSHNAGSHFPHLTDPDPMKTHYIEEAAKVVPNKQQLINIVSKRLRELSAGSRPMIEVDLQMGLADVALAEVAAGKLTAEASLSLETEQAA